MKNFKLKVIAACLIASVSFSIGAQQPAQQQVQNLATQASLKAPLALRGYAEFERPVKLPNFRLYTLGGEEVDLNKYKGKLVILNLWASWCTPCIKEIPELTQLQKQLKGSNILIQGVNIEPNYKQVERFLRKSLYQGFETWIDPSLSIPNSLPIAGIPVNLVINGAGEIVAFIPGYVQWDSAEVKPFLKKLEEKFTAKKI